MLRYKKYKHMHHTRFNISPTKLQNMTPWSQESVKAAEDKKLSA